MNGRTISRLAYAAGFVFLLGARGAVAADTYREAMIQAVTAKENALDTQKATDWREALAQFQSADSIHQTPESKYEIGFAASQLGETGLALEAYSVALELGLGGNAGQKARAYVVAHSHEVSRLVVTGTAGTRLFVRGIERGQLPLTRPIIVEPETVTLDVLSATGDRTSQTVRLQAGQIAAVSLAEPGPVTPPSRGETAEVPESANRPANPISFEKSTKTSAESRSKYPNAAHRQAGWAFMSGGTSLVALSVVSLIVSTNKISESRRDLFDRCAVQTNGPDTCAHAKLGQQESAQSASDAIATWEAVRTGSWVGVSVGLASVVGGAAWLRSSNSDTVKSARLPNIVAGPHHLHLSYSGSF